jgi:hypothetical protein
MRLAAIPDWGNSGSLHQRAWIPEPGDPRYPVEETAP